jgi:formylglycine-generating enzyme required for sulfatase activity
MQVMFSTICILAGLHLSAAIPEMIYPKTKVIKPVEWYEEQALLWKDVVLSKSENGQAWLNYYAASRYAHSSQEHLDAITQDVETAIPNTFESLLITGWNGGYSDEAYTSILRANSVNPSHPVALGLVVLMHELHGEAQERKKASERIFQSHGVSPSLLNYSYNVLMSVEPGAILITEGDNTTLPLYLLQDILNVRRDVVVLNLEMLMNEQYRKHKFGSLGIDMDFTAATHLQLKKDICTKLPSKNRKYSFYYALTLSRENLVTIKDQLYVVGLASQLSERRIDNISVIRENLEKKFLLDYLAVDFNGESHDAAGKVLQANYLVPMLLLDEHYRKSGEQEKADALEQIIRAIAEQTGKKTLVENYLRRESNDIVSFVPYKVDTKALEGRLKNVKDNVFAHEYEVTNAEYNAFLEYLYQNKRIDLYEQCKVQLDQYQEPALSFMRSYHINRQTTKKEKYFTNYPVVNITLEAAQAYCQWLTEQYHVSAERKYKKVQFRLPTIKEWQLAAAGIKNPASWDLAGNSVEVKIYEAGKAYSKKYEKKTVTLDDPEILYPWFKNYNFRNTVLNDRGCALGNFKFAETQRPCVPSRMTTADGFWMMSAVQAYFPNDIGLYDVVGNVAEMTSERGKACGGSWNHPPEESTIKSINLYTGPQADTGFRVFMEVIEP